MVRPYQPSDFGQIKQWGDKWGASYDKEAFPPTGFIYPNVCAYFLYETKSNVCFLENLVKNPDADPELAERAIEMVITRILLEARSLGYKTAFATTDNKAVIKRAVSHNASAVPNQTVLSLRFK